MTVDVTPSGEFSSPTYTAMTGNVIPSLGREGVVTTFYGNPRQVFLSLGVKF